MGDSLMMDLLQSVLAAAYGGHFLSTEVEALSFSNPNLPLLSFPFRFVIDQPDEIDNSKKKIELGENVWDCYYKGSLTKSKGKYA